LKSQASLTLKLSTGTQQGVEVTWPYPWAKLVFEQNGNGDIYIYKSYTNWTNIYSKHMQTLANHHKPTCLSNTITIKSKNSSTIFISIKSKSQPPVKRVHFSPLST
jgi:hypothetical protein